MIHLCFYIIGGLITAFFCGLINLDFSEYGPLPAFACLFWPIGLTCILCILMFKIGNKVSKCLK